MPNALPSDRTWRVQNQVAAFAVSDGSASTLATIPNAAQLVRFNLGLDGTVPANTDTSVWGVLSAERRMEIMSTISTNFVVGVKFRTQLSYNWIAQVGGDFPKGVGIFFNGELVHEHEREHGVHHETYVPVQAPGPQLLRLLQSGWGIRVNRPSGADGSGSGSGTGIAGVVTMLVFVRGNMSHAFSSAYGLL